MRANYVPCFMLIAASIVSSNPLPQNALNALLPTVGRAAGTLGPLDVGTAGTNPAPLPGRPAGTFGPTDVGTVGTVGQNPGNPNPVPIPVNPPGNPTGPPTPAATKVQPTTGSASASVASITSAVSTSSATSTPVAADPVPGGSSALDTITTGASAAIIWTVIAVALLAVIAFAIYSRRKRNQRESERLAHTPPPPIEGIMATDETGYETAAGANSDVEHEASRGAGLDGVSRSLSRNSAHYTDLPPIPQDSHGLRNGLLGVGAIGAAGILGAGVLSKKRSSDEDTSCSESRRQRRETNATTRSEPVKVSDALVSDFDETEYTASIRSPNISESGHGDELIAGAITAAGVGTIAGTHSRNNDVPSPIEKDLATDETTDVHNSASANPFDDNQANSKSHHGAEKASAGALGLGVGALAALHHAQKDASNPHTDNNEVSHAATLQDKHDDAANAESQDVNSREINESPTQPESHHAAEMVAGAGLGAATFAAVHASKNQASDNFENSDVNYDGSAFNENKSPIPTFDHSQPLPATPPKSPDHHILEAAGLATGAGAVGNSLAHTPEYSEVSVPLPPNIKSESGQESNRNSVMIFEDPNDSGADSDLAVTVASQHANSFTGDAASSLDFETRDHNDLSEDEASSIVLNEAPKEPQLPPLPMMLNPYDSALKRVALKRRSSSPILKNDEYESYIKSLMAKDDADIQKQDHRHE